MKIRVLIIVILAPFISFCGNGFLGYTGQVGLNISELITQKKVHIFADYFQKRSLAFGIGLTYMNRTLDPNSSGFQYIAQSATSTNNSIGIKGGELVFRGNYSNTFQNNILPVGISFFGSIGFGTYTNENTLPFNGNPVTYERKMMYGIYDFGLQNTFHIYERLNLFIGIHANYSGPLGRSWGDEPSSSYTDYDEYLPNFGMNQAVQKTNFFGIGGIRFNIKYGITILL